ncbi:MAG: glutamate carboxypeptidase [Gemmatimonadales bacterium]|nr:MAG: glutamate carboxypeptidase [Gemmatimonadales bacterium]
MKQRFYRTWEAVAVAAGLWAFLGGALQAQQHQRQITEFLDSRYGELSSVARQIWSWAEVGYQEEKSSALLAEKLREAGFRVQTGVAEIPTAFVASYGQGRPVIALLAEFDALPGLSQDTVPERKPLPGRDAGHACGHHLFGTAAVGAGIAVKEWLQKERRSGTIRVYGTPAEEGGSGKVYMVRAGLFDDVDVVLSWHPGDENDAGPSTNLANKSAKFRFHGLSAHAAAAPERGRSALDAVEAMNFMANLMREHVPSTSRIHYVITAGGRAPNVVPDYAEVYYYVRHPDPRTVEELFQRLVKAAEGAALGTGTTMDYEVIGGTYSRLPNETLAKVVDANLRLVGGVTYTPEEQALAEKIYATLAPTGKKLGSQSEVEPYEMHVTNASSDAGDVSWVVPSAQFTAATWVPGTPAHSWQAVAAGGTSIGFKGMMVAAKTLALSAVDLYLQPRLVEEARREFEAKRGPNFTYRPLLGDRPPALDYRK